MASLIKVGEPTTQGERIMLRHLEQRLPASWYVVGNSSIRHGRQDREIDAIVIGDGGVWVIDEKSYSGVITGDENVWVLQNGTQIEGVLRKVLFAAKLVGGKIAQKCPGIKRRVYVDGIVLLTARKVRLNVQDESVKHHVWRLADCERTFLGATTVIPHPLLPKEREALLRAIVGNLLVDQRQGYQAAATAQATHQHQSVDRGGHPPDQSALALRLDGEGGFRRVYYNDVLLGSRELRGAVPASTVRTLKGTGVRLRFDGGAITLEPLHSRLSVRVGRRMLSPGNPASLGHRTTSVHIEDIKLQATVMEITQEDNDENR